MSLTETVIPRPTLRPQPRSCEDRETATEVETAIREEGGFRLYLYEIFLAQAANYEVHGIRQSALTAWACDVEDSAMPSSGDHPELRHHALGTAKIALEAYRDHNVADHPLIQEFRTGVISVRDLVTQMPGVGFTMTLLFVSLMGSNPPPQAK